MISPYVLPSDLINSPVGMDWTSFPVPGSTANQQLAGQWDMCFRATSAADAFVNQTLRATIYTQNESAPNRRVSVDPNGVARFVCDEWPVRVVVSGQTSNAAAFPRQWQPIDSTQWDIDGYTVMNGSYDDAADGPNTILLAPGIVYGYRRSLLLQLQYISGWANAGITAAVAVNDVTIHVDDITGYTLATVAVPIIGRIPDLAKTEYVTITGTTPSGIAASGPGTLTLATGAVFAHSAPTDGVPACLITTMPANISRAIVWLALADAMVRGAMAVTVPDLPGSEVHSGSKDDLEMMGYEALLPYRRSTQ
jgi:hypothetical protein